MATERPRNPNDVGTRAEHLAWCKERALEYVAQGDLEGALASMFSDLRKHSDTVEHPGILLGGMLMVADNLNTPGKVRDFIEGFN